MACNTLVVDDVSVLFINQSVARLDEAVSAPPSDPHSRGRWAHRLCARTRRINMEVWSWRPVGEVAVDNVIRALERARKAILTVPACDAHPTDQYARNVAARIANLHRYALGLESAFDPGELNPGKSGSAG